MASTGRLACIAFADRSSIWQCALTGAPGTAASGFSPPRAFLEKAAASGAATAERTSDWPKQRRQVRLCSRPVAFSSGHIGPTHNRCSGAH